MTEEQRITVQEFDGPTNVARMVRLGTLVEELTADAEATARARAENRPRGPVTGLPPVDEELGGFLAPGVHLLQAAPGAGKTSFCLQAATHCGFPALVVTTEMPVLELFRRLVARTTSTFLGKLRSGDLDPAVIAEKARATAAQCPMVAFLDATAGPAKPDFIISAADAIRNRQGAPGVLVVLDSLHAWARSVVPNATDYEAVSGACTSLHALAGRLACPVLAVSHRNRVGQREGGLHDGKGSGDLEYTAESVLELVPGDGTPVRDVTLRIHKNRHGSAGIDLALKFEGRLQQFREA